jgi:hypothetical protein
VTKEQGIVDDSPGIPYFNKVFNAGGLNGIKRRITIGAVDVGSGEFVTFN